MALFRVATIRDDNEFRVFFESPGVPTLVFLVFFEMWVDDSRALAAHHTG